MQPIILLTEHDDGTLVIALNPEHHNPLSEVQAVADRDAADALIELLGDSGLLEAGWVVEKDSLNSPDGDLYHFPSDICYSLLGHGEVALEGEERQFEPVVWKRSLEWEGLPLSYKARNTAQAKKMGALAVETGDYEKYGWEGNYRTCDAGSDIEIPISGAVATVEVALERNDPFYYKDVSKQRPYLWRSIEGNLDIRRIYAQGVDMAPGKSVSEWGIFIAEPTDKEVTALHTRPIVGNVIEHSDYGRLLVLFTFLNPS